MSEDRLTQIKRNFSDSYERLKQYVAEDMIWLISELEKCRAEVEQLKKTIKELGWQQIDIPPQKRHQFSLLFQRRHRKWALKEMKDKQALWRNYAGEVSEQMDEVEKCRAEVKRLKALLAHKGIPL